MVGIVRQWFPNVGVHQNPLEGLLNPRSLGPTPEFLIQQFWSEPQNLHFRQFSGDAVVADPQTKF